MQVKELIAKLSVCVPDAEIGFKDFDGIYEIDGVGLTLYGAEGIEGMIYTLRPTEDEEEVIEISNSLNQEIGKNYITELHKAKFELTTMNEIYRSTLSDLVKGIQSELDKDGWCRLVVKEEKLEEIKMLLDSLEN